MRRGRLWLGAVAVALGVVALALLSPGGSARPSEAGSTIHARWSDRDGNGVLAVGPGEPLVARTELGPPARAVRQLALFAHLTDAHVRDEESPARLTALDRLGAPFDSVFRPQEALTPQVLAATVRSLGRLHPQAVIEGGDLIDNDQANELAQALEALRGGRVNPDSGRRGYNGVQAPDDPDPFYYRPDLDAPRHPGLLAAAQRPFRSPGLRTPWYPVAGNHDVLVDGELAATAATQRVAAGTTALLSLDPRADVPRSERALTGALIDRFLARELPGATLRVPADQTRRELSAEGVLTRLRAGSGHGASEPRLDYSFDIGRSVRAIVLDLARRDWGSGGLVRPEQVAWLERELRRAGSRWVVVFSHQPLTSSTGGGGALGLLDGDPRVLATVSGHTHRNRITPRRTSAGGYWLIGTASLADWPQQARALRLVQTEGGGVALETWMVDGSGDRLADVSRQLAFLDWQGGRPNHHDGGRLDRNVVLYRGAPGR